MRRGLIVGLSLLFACGSWVETGSAATDECSEYSGSKVSYTVSNYKVMDGVVSRGTLTIQTSGGPRKAVINGYSWQCSEKQPLNKAIESVPRNCSFTILQGGKKDWHCDCNQSDKGFACIKLRAARCFGYHQDPSNGGAFKSGMLGIDFVPAGLLPKHCVGWASGDSGEIQSTSEPAPGPNEKLRTGKSIPGG